MGTVQVVNPTFDPNLVVGQPDPQNPSEMIQATDARLKKTIARDYGFGPDTGSRSITLSNNAALTINSWTNDAIVVTLPATGSTGQLTITRSNGKQSVVGLTVHRSPALLGTPRKVNPGGSNVAGCGMGSAAPCRTIQYAIDQTTAANVLLNNLITIAPGVYNEFVIMDKRVRLQGWGAGAVTINAAKSSAGALSAWRAQINARANAPINLGAGPGGFNTLPGQATPDPFAAEEAPGILVAGRQGVLNGLLNECLGGSLARLQIDGVTVTGGDSGGGILASGYACGLEVSNNRVVANYGTYGGGIRVGHTVLATDTAYTDGVNRAPHIHHNWISQNGATEAGGGGGLTLGTGSSSYAVTNNYICGNFSMADGGGMGHLGVSPGEIGGNNNAPLPNRIVQNKFIFNQTFNQAADPTGAGLFIGGQIPLGGGNGDGTGDVVIDANLFQGNQAGAGAGGGVSIARTLSSNNAGARDDIVLTNNMIVNNVAAYTGGGVALTNTGNGVRLINNTIASNASTGTNRQALGTAEAGTPVPQVAGVSVLGGASPTLLNNVLWANRSFVFSISASGENPQLIDPPAGETYLDLGRVAGSGALIPRYSVLTDTTANRAAYDLGVGGCTNTAPTSGTTICNRFVASNSTTLFAKANVFDSVVDPTQPIVLPEVTVLLQNALTFDEGGNFVNVIFSPLTLWDRDSHGTMLPTLRADYHLNAADTIATNHGRARASNTSNFNVTIGATLVPTVDVDADARPQAVDIGADERLIPLGMAAFSPSPVAFGNVPTGQNRTITVTVTNTGNAALVISTAIVSGTRFGKGADTCTGATVAVNAYCTVAVTFNPNNNTQRTGSLTLTHNGTDSPSSVALSGQ
jgi:hypothetical protein